jgi:hypothetical protein
MVVISSIIEKESIGIESINLHFKIENKYNKDLFFISENTPFDSYITDCFIIKYNNEHTVDFDGRFVKKIDHTEIIQLKAGETISKIIPVSESYQISKKGSYSIYFNSSKFNISDNKYELIGRKCNFNIINSGLIEINNEACSFLINEKFGFIETLGEKFRLKDNNKKAGDIVVRNGSSKQKDILKRIYNEILIFSADLNLKHDDLYKMWFGVPDNVTYVSNKYSSIFSLMENKSTEFYIVVDESENMSNLIAETTKGGKRIVIYKNFWDLTDYAFNSKFGTLIHEFSHIICSTVDSENEIECTRLLAKIDVNRAINSANNYEYYIEDLLW